MENTLTFSRQILDRTKLDRNNYTISLIKEGFPLGLISKDDILNLQEQIGLLLRKHILQYTNGESTSVKVETAEMLLNSIYYSLDAYLKTMDCPEIGLNRLSTVNAADLYEEGLKLLVLWVEESKFLLNRLIAEQLEIPVITYNETLNTALPQFFADYNLVFNAQNTACMIDYPLAFDDMRVQGIAYIRNYLEHLDIETEFCKLFPIGELNALLSNYGRLVDSEYFESPINIFELLLINVFFATLLKKGPCVTKITRDEAGRLGRVLSIYNQKELETLTDKAFKDALTDLNVTSYRIKEYVLRYRRVFMPRFVTAIESNSLCNIVITCD